MILRPIYFRATKKMEGQKMIKIITGITRCDKFTLLDLYINHLKEIGIKENRIISVNLE